jgi:sulfur carrier protein
MSQCRITLNGEPREVPADLPVRAVVALLTPAPEGVAVAVNGWVVARGRWDSDRVQDGDAVEVVRAVQGG